MTDLEQHQREIQQNLESWGAKSLLRELYAEFYQKILSHIQPNLPGQIVEIGSGIGNLKSHLPQSISTDLFPNPWLDLVCDLYELPFESASVSHLILFDVFHHLEAPSAAIKEAHRVLKDNGRIILFEPYISLLSLPAYGLFHHEPVAWGQSISSQETLPRPRHYYAAQGNATRVFFREGNSTLLNGWKVMHKEAFATFAYLLSGGFSKPPLYPESWKARLQKGDAFLSRWPRVFGGRCLVVLEKMSFLSRAW